ncbi:MAG: HRDC domain-containing protein [Nanoarchaeales archaeon]|nr:HRDC domain-containing protein [Nanoarchaeales archaeon]
MAKYLDTQNISASISNLVKKARDDLIIMSPYLKVNSQLKDLIQGKAKNSNNITIKIIYGKTDLKQEELNWIKDCEDIRLFYKENLHAKCYISDDTAIITSMNLYEFSQVNNNEMGILLTRENDREAYSDLWEDVRFIIDNSKRIKDFEETKEVKKESIQIEEKKEELKQELSRKDKVLFSILKNWRYEKSKEKREPAYRIFKDTELEAIIKTKADNISKLKEIKGISTKKISSFGSEILNILKDLEKYSIVEIIDTQYEYDSVNGYDRVKVKYLDSNKEEWLDTVKSLPKKGSIVGAKINKTWFNDSFEAE